MGVPGRLLLGPGWLRELRGPFPEAKFVATGGIGAHNAPEYLAAGAQALAGRRHRRATATCATAPGGPEGRPDARPE